MNARPETHPADSQLQRFALGKLDESAIGPIMAHLEGCVECRRRIAELPDDSFAGKVRAAHSPDGTPVPNESAWQNALSIGKTFQQPAGSPLPPIPSELADLRGYEITRKLGEGGMGVVYLARNTAMNRPEVLKVMNKSLVGKPEAVERFQQEIQSAAQLLHANVATAFSVHSHGDLLVLAMEYVDGADLAKVVRDRGPLPITNACFCAHQAAMGLQRAHEMGMVHRDIKPGNILLSKQGKRPIVKVIDFGLAKARSEIAAGRELTGTNQMMGTPGYSAPEQLDDAKSADIRSDIYALGCTLYYLLAGEAPFKGNSAYAIVLAQAAGTVRPVCDLRPEIPVELAAIVAKMMAKEPADRFQIPSEVAAALVPFFKGTKPSPSANAESRSSGKAREPHSTLSRAKATPATQLSESGPWSGIEDHTAKQDRQSIEWKPSLAERWSAGAGKRLWLPILIGLAMLIGAVALGGIVLRVKTPTGTIVIENVPSDADVRVDGGKVDFSPGETTVTINRLSEGQHQLKVTCGGQEIKLMLNGRDFSTEVTVTVGSKPLRIRVEAIPKRRSPDPISEQNGNFGSQNGTADRDMENGKKTPRSPLPGTTPPVDGEVADHHSEPPIQEKTAENVASPDDPVTKANASRNDKTGAAPNDGITVGSVWKGEMVQYREGSKDPTTSENALSIDSRNGDKFEATLIGTMNTRKISGTIRNGRMLWLAKDVKALRGHEGQDTEGELHGDELWLRFRGVTKSPPVGIRTWGISKLKRTDATGSDAKTVLDDGFIPLFNGRDLSGWEMPPENGGSWTVYDGELIGQGGGREGSPSWLVSKRKNFSDFRLRMEVSNPDGTTKQAIVRANLEGGNVNGYRIQMKGIESLGDYRTAGSISKAQNAERGAIIKWDVVAKDAPIRDGESYLLEVMAIGNTFTSYVNGRQVATYTDKTNSFRKGAILLVCRAAADAQLRVRRIEIKELSTEGISGQPPEEKNKGDEAANTVRDVGFVSLFNGKDKSGWTAHPKVEDRSEVVGDVIQMPGRCLLCTKSTKYSNFVLKASAKVEQGSAGGIWFRSSLGTNFNHAYQLQVNTMEEDTDAGLPPTGSIKAIYAERNEVTVLKKVSPGKIKPGEWFEIELTAKGNEFSVKLNGESVLQTVDPARRFARGGIIIGLTKGTQSSWRDLKIKELPAN
jgi:serine/threonine protein kinase